MFVEIIIVTKPIMSIVKILNTSRAVDGTATVGPVVCVKTLGVIGFAVPVRLFLYNEMSGEIFCFFFCF